MPGNTLHKCPWVGDKGELLAWHAWRLHGHDTAGAGTVCNYLLMHLALPGVVCRNHALHNCGTSAKLWVPTCGR